MSATAHPTDDAAADPPAGRALALGYWRCESCGTVCHAPATDARARCPRCGDVVQARRADSLSRTWAYLIAATALYVPANLLPVTATSSLLGAQSDTLLSGIVFLWAEGSWALALVVLVASILVPMGKLLVLSFLLLSVHRKERGHALLRARMFRLLEVVGRWSMLDVFVVTVLAALVQVGSFAQLRAGPGAVAFGAVVVLTMLATRSFDPRLIWDSADEEDEDDR